MPDDDIDSYWEGIRPRRESPRSPTEPAERPGPPHGLIDQHNPDTGLRTISSLRRRPPDTWAEFEPLSTREQRIRNHAYMDGLSNREEPNGNSPLNRLMSSLAALGITGSVGQERLSNGNRAVWFLIEPVPNELPHFRIGTRVTQNGGVGIVVEFPED